MKLQQIRNATVKLTYGNTTFLIDPWLQDQGTGMCAPVVKESMKDVKSPIDPLPLSVEEILDGVDYLLITHVHPDHFKPDYLPKNINVLVQNQIDYDKVIAHGFVNVEIIEKVKEFDSFKMTRVQGVHADNELLKSKMGEVSGFVFESSNEKTLYVAGDTVYYEGVEENLKTFNPAVTVVNCCEATTPQGRLIMNISDVEQVLAYNSEMMVVASHLDSVNHALLTRQDYYILKQKKNYHNLYIPLAGETILI